MKRMQIGRRACLLLSLLLLVTGCEQQGTEQIGQEEQITTMGRYVEEELSLPKGVGTVKAFHAHTDGTISLFAGDGANVFEPSQAWELYQSKDTGRTWTVTTPACFADLSGKMVTAAAYDSQDNLYIAPYSEEEPDTSQILKIGEDGEVTVITVPVPLIVGLQLTNQGDLLISTLESTIEQYDMNGIHRQSFSPVTTSDMQLISFTSHEHILAVSTGSRLVTYDMDTGAQIDSAEIAEGYFSDEWIDFPGGTLQYQPDSDSYYFSNRAGIYRHTAGGELLERLVEGELCSFSTPSMVGEYMVALEDSFLLVCQNEATGSVLLQYSWRDDIATWPEKELTIYSLREDKTVRQAIGAYLQAHPDVFITYEVALSDGLAVTPTDAITLLNTQLLADQGPDILILDGLPIEAYAEKGALADLSDQINPLIEDASLFTHVANAYREENGALYGVPARFGVPVLLADDAAVGTIHSFADLIDWGVAKKEENPAIRSFISTNPEALFYELYSTCAPAWFAEDGRLNKAALEEFLEGLYRIAQSGGGETLEDTVLPFDFAMFSAFWKDGPLLLDTGTMQNPYAIYLPYSNILQKGEGSVVPLPGQAQNVFVPQTILGINNATAYPELASDFIELALSQKVQDIRLDDGFPVNTDSFALTMTEKAYGSHIFEDSYWPTEEYWSAFQLMVAELDTPAKMDAVLQSMILEQARAYFDGTTPLQQVMDDISQKLDIYLMES